MSILINRIIRDSYLVRAAKKAQALMERRVSRRADREYISYLAYRVINLVLRFKSCRPCAAYRVDIRT